MTPFRHYAKFTLNVPQARFLTVMANESWLFMGRGTGKTQGCTAPWTLHKVEVMPGSCGALIGQSFSDLEAKIIKPLFMGFQMLGHEYDVHFTYGTKPPAHWTRPIIPIIDWSHVIAFPNGTTIQLVSLHQKGSANSNSFQWMIGPEAKFFDPVQLRQEAFPTLRGLTNQFGKSPWYGAKMFETDKYGADIHWILEKRKLHDEAIIKTVIYYQLQYNDLRLKLATATESNAYRIRLQMSHFQEMLNMLRHQLVFVGEASAYDNIANLQPEYFDNMKRSLSKYEYEVAVLNMDPTKVDNNFYSGRTDRHLYTKLNDEDMNKPLAVALDYQASFSPLVWCQLNDLVIPGTRSLNFIGSMYVKQPFGRKHVVDQFCEHYKDRPCKEVLYYYDHTANDEQNGRKRKWEETADYFKANGWKVSPQYMGQAPLHSSKFDRINNYLENENPEQHPPIRIHRSGCADMLMSMDLSETLETSSGTKKDKTKEKDKKFPQEYAPHLSDTFDMLVWAIIEKKMYPVTTPGLYTGVYFGG